MGTFPKVAGIRNATILLGLVSAFYLGANPAHGGTVGDGPVLTFVEVHRDGVNGVDGLERAQSVTLSPDGAHVYVASFVENAVAVFSRNATTGSLTFVEVQRADVNGPGLFGASSVAVSPDGAHVYVASFYDDGIAVFSRNATTGTLTFVEVQREGLAGASSVTVSPDGTHVYVANLGNDGVAVFSRDSLTGALTFVEAQRDGNFGDTIPYYSVSVALWVRSFAFGGIGQGFVQAVR